MVISSQSSTVTPIPDDISQELSAYRSLTTDEKLGLLWVVYENMGGSITPAAPGAAAPQFTSGLFEQVKAMNKDAQLGYMRDLVEQRKTAQTEAYAKFSDDNKLVFWYQLSEGMAAGDVIQVPDDYSMSGATSQVFSKITALEFNQQITLLRHMVIDMGA